LEFPPDTSEICLDDDQCVILKLFSGPVVELYKGSVILSFRTEWSWKDYSY